MKNKKTLIAIFVVLVIVIVIAVVFYPKKTGTEQAPVIPENQITRVQLPSGTELVVYHDTPKAESKPLSLTAGNFESLVSTCLKGESCVVEDDPLKMYQGFKTAGNTRAIENLISFLRSQLKKPELKDKYKSAVRSMIDDFYPAQEKQFQEAAYYNYLGDLNKSLELYLDLKEKSKKDAALRGAPNLNIANTYYEMKNYAAAQPFYEEAFLDYTSGKIKSDPDPTSFIEERISEIKARLYHYQ
ncbi:tetratricopeptide repeat protein [Bdellovibrio sp. SKB1291214]|uniref:tetratricopeptide repeat protein n=1 Tax=Bdellovibrio sp. SKB1291214 TaxID=1732569 RepID=UPI000B518D0C|nr:tetratricopeptide repeat protein [Bdellovibrio sp. SKB1291214]UYL08174.1 tetratricopeptide repeat protein [Bdellovibrio sp. SKB1291214]